MDLLENDLLELHSDVLCHWQIDRSNPIIKKLKTTVSKLRYAFYSRYDHDSDYNYMSSSIKKFRILFDIYLRKFSNNHSQYTTDVIPTPIVVSSNLKRKFDSENEDNYAIKKKKNVSFDETKVFPFIDPLKEFKYYNMYDGDPMFEIKISEEMANHFTKVLFLRNKELLVDMGDGGFVPQDEIKIKFSIDVLNDLTKVIKETNHDKIFINVTLSFNFGYSHANFILLDKIKKTVLRFEPHGAKKNGTYNSERLDNILSEYFNFNLLRYIPPSEYDRENGVQMQYNETKNVMGYALNILDERRVLVSNGYCVVWCYFILGFFLMYGNEYEYKTIMEKGIYSNTNLIVKIKRFAGYMTDTVVGDLYRILESGSVQDFYKWRDINDNSERKIQLTNKEYAITLIANNKKYKDTLIDIFLTYFPAPSSSMSKAQVALYIFKHFGTESLGRFLDNFYRANVDRYTENKLINAVSGNEYMLKKIKRSFQIDQTRTHVGFLEKINDMLYEYFATRPNLLHDDGT